MPALRKKTRKLRVFKTTPEKEQAMKDQAFLKMTPAEHLRFHQQPRKRIWGERYNAGSLKGCKVIKKPAYP